MNDSLVLPRASDDLFVHVPVALNRKHLQEVISQHLSESVRIHKMEVKNMCAGMPGGVACSGATVLCIHLKLSNNQTLDLVAKILSPDPVNLYKIDCRYDSRIAEARWADWWGSRNVPWVPVVYDVRALTARREFWILQEFFPQVGWKYMPESERGDFRLNDEDLRQMVETVAELHAESYRFIDKLRQLFPEAGIEQGGECRLANLEAALDDVIDDEWLFRTVGIGAQERDKLKAYRECVAKRPRWLDDWRTVCVNGDLKPSNFGFRENDGGQPVMFDFGAARLAPMEEELALLLSRLQADEAEIEVVLSMYLDRFARRTGERIRLDDFKRRLPWAEPLLMLRSLVEHTEALRWVSCQDRSKGFIRHFIGAIEGQFERCSSCE